MSTGAGMRPWRVPLFVPGDRPERIARAAACGADAVVADLEDAVAPSRLALARSRVAAELARIGGPAAPARVVRVHPATHPECAADVRAVTGPWLDAVMLPKADAPEDVVALDALLTDAEAAAGIEPGRIAVAPLVESCRGLLAAGRIAAASARVSAMVFSSGEEGDFMADLGGRWTPDGAALHYPRSSFACAVRAAGTATLIDGVCMHLDDPQVLHQECVIARTLGFDGKSAVHPRQVPAIVAAFTPAPGEVAAARGLLEAMASARAEGRAVIRFRGRMVDAANERVARRILARAGAAGPGGGAGLDGTPRPGPRDTGSPGGRPAGGGHGEGALAP